RAPSPRTRAALARLDPRGPATERQRHQAPRPTRRIDPRIPPRRSMNRHFETPHAGRGLTSLTRRKRLGMSPRPGQPAAAAMTVSGPPAARQPAGQEEVGSYGDDGSHRAEARDAKRGDGPGDDGL